MCSQNAMKTQKEFWRRGWDLNPRLSFPNTRFPSVLLKPLGHLSAVLQQRNKNAGAEEACELRGENNDLREVNAGGCAGNPAPGERA